MAKLFPMKTDFRIIELRKSDVWGRTDYLKIFRNFILSNREMYPRIDEWVDKKVIPQIGTTQRIAYLGLEDDKPVVSAVLKPGKRSKFCHLKIDQDFQDIGLGEVFFSIMALQCRNKAREIHFTLPEHLWHTKQEFFESFGFTKVGRALSQYRKGNEELRCSAPFQTVWQAVLEKLPKLRTAFHTGGYSLDSGLVMSLTPQYAEAVLEGGKKVEIRKSFSKKWRNHEVTIYASHPVGQIVGKARIGLVVKDNPETIWEHFESDIGANKEAFDTYVGSADQVYAIFLEEIISFREPIPLEQLSYLLGEDLKPPQTYLSMRNSEVWAQAVSIASLLHGSFTRPLPTQDTKDDTHSRTLCEIS